MPTDLQQFCKVHEDVLTRASITCDNVAHALGLVSSRETPVMSQGCHTPQVVVCTADQLTAYI